MKRTDSFASGSVSVTGAAAPTREPAAAGAAGAACANASAGARQSSAPAVNNEAKMRLIACSLLSFSTYRSGEGVGHEVNDEPVLPVHQQHVAPDVAVSHLLRQLRQPE